MSNKNNKLSKERLLKSEYDKYLSIGEPDYSQNWLELFTPTIISDLFTIMGSCSANQQKSDYVQDELGQYGFEPLGLGTNVYAMWHPGYPGVAFKVALDSAGLADNYNDEVLYELINKILADAGKKPRYTKPLMRHPTGIVSVQERKVLVATQDRMDSFRGSILKTLQLLAHEFLIVDMSPTLFQFNYGIERNGDWCFIDASDLYPLKNLDTKLRCTKALGSDRKTGGIVRCHGPLRYTDDFSAIVCDRCGKEYIPSEFRPNDKEETAAMANAFMDGMSPKEREFMEAEELAAMSRRMYGAIKHSASPAEPEDPKPAEDESDENIPDPEEEVEKGLDLSAEPEEAPKPIVPPPKLNRQSIFRDPKKDLMDRSGKVEAIHTGVESTVTEPSLDTIRAMSTSFTPSVVELRSGDDDDDEEQANTIEPVATEPAAGDAPVEEKQDEDDDEPKMIYNIVRAESIAGIMIQIPKGLNTKEGQDFEELYKDCGLGIYVTNDGGKSVIQAVSADALINLIRNAYEEVEDL